MSGHTKVYGFCENGCKVEVGAHSKAFTYEVNSDASLEYWLSNKASGTSSGGDDFTSVLIRKGTWNFTGETEALDDIGTLYVEGEAGSKLVFTDTIKAFWYNAVDTKTSMMNINIDCSHDGTSGCTGFTNCSNLTYCRCISTSSKNGTCFDNCQNLTNCEGTGIGTGTQRIGTGFYLCSNLINCVGKGIALNAYQSNGFDSCSNLTNCVGVGLANEIGSGFKSCKVVHGCKAGGHCKTSVFDSSYASHSATSTYACADTANGGFNDTTNPAAT